MQFKTRQEALRDAQQAAGYDGPKSVWLVGPGVYVVNEYLPGDETREGHIYRVTSACVVESTHKQPA